MADLGQIADTYDSIKKFVGIKKKKKRRKPSALYLIGDFNLKNSPLSSKRRFFVSPVNSAKALRSKVHNGKRI